MKLLSFRRDFDSRIWLGPAQYRVDQGSIYADDAAIEQLQSETAGKRILFLIHGYSVDAHGCLKAYGDVADRMAAAGLLGPTCRYQDVVGVLWPGQTVAGFAPAIYAANASGDRLAEVFQSLRCQSISIETHSLGARVGMRAVSKSIVRDLILTSPAVSSKCLEVGGEFEQSAANARAVEVCYSNNDPVLGHWYRYFEWVLHWLQLSSGDTALGLTGPAETGNCRSNIHARDFSQLINDHSGWRWCGPFFLKWYMWSCKERVSL